MTPNAPLDILIEREIDVASPSDPFNPGAVPPEIITLAVPASRHDPAVGDETRERTGAYFGLDDVRYRVRVDATYPWAVGDRFTDETGRRRTVLGIRQTQPRGHLPGAVLEMICRGVS